MQLIRDPSDGRVFDISQGTLRKVIDPGSVMHQVRNVSSLPALPRAGSASLSKLRDEEVWAATEARRRQRGPAMPAPRLTPSSQFLGIPGLGGIIGGIIGGTGGGVIGKIGDWIGDQFDGDEPRPPGLPALPPMPQLPAMPTPGFGGVVERVLPGGRSGYLGMPMPVIEVEYEERATVPRGYVVVTVNGEKVGMLKELARKYGLWKPRPKPPVSGWDARAITRAARAQKKVKNLAGKVGYTCKPKGRGR